MRLHPRFLAFLGAVLGPNVRYPVLVIIGLAGILAAGLAFAMTMSVPAGGAVSGDAAGWSEMKAAFKKLDALPSYRWKRVAEKKVRLSS